MLQVCYVAARERDYGTGANEVRVLVYGVAKLLVGAAAVGGAGRNIVPVAALREPHMMGHSARDAVNRSADCRREDVVSEHEFVFFGI